MRLYITRHGQTDWNKGLRIQGCSDTPLNETGREQALRLTQTVAALESRPTRIYSSPLLRARDTANTIAGAIGVNCVIVPGLTERSFGLWEGMTWDEVKAQYPEEYRNWSQIHRYQCPPEGESYHDLLRRTVGTLQEIIASEGGAQSSSCILCVSHSAVIHGIRAYMANPLSPESVQLPHLSNASLLTFDARRLEHIHFDD